jgi:hypothetical protein
VIANAAVAIAAGVAAGALTWAVQTRLANKVRTLRAHYTPGPHHARFDTDTTREDDQAGAARPAEEGSDA